MLPDTTTPCYMCPKVPESVRKAKQEAGEEVYPSDAIVPDEEAFRVVDVHLACRAVNAFPDDPIVRQHALLVHPFVEAHARRPIAQMLNLLDAVVAGGGPRRGRR